MREDKSPYHVLPVVIWREIDLISSSSAKAASSDGLWGCLRHLGNFGCPDCIVSFVFEAVIYRSNQVEFFHNFVFVYCWISFSVSIAWFYLR